MKGRDRLVRLGYELGSGHVVEIPIRHMVVTGQTQEAGKTTTLEALITRSELRALTFITKRGELAFAGCRRIGPFFREATDWQSVAAILEASRGEKLKLERAWIIRASKGARTLADVQRNVRKLQESAKGMSADMYLLLESYLEVIVPALARVKWAPRVELDAGVNVMDLTAIPVELQHLVIRSSLEWLLEHAEDVVVVVPEAWKYLPQGHGSPVKHAAHAFIRQGAALRNYLWLDSQDIGGVDKETLRSCPVWLLGVQRESNEVKRTLANIPATVRRPRPADVAQLELGQFVACWGKHTRRVYVQPAWMDASLAGRVAQGLVSAEAAGLTAPPARPVIPLENVSNLRPALEGERAQHAADAAIAEHLAYHGPGLTFGELAIGERFEWAAPSPHSPEPMVKTAANGYEWSRGRGTAQAYYRVERAERGEEMNAQQEKKLDDLGTSIGHLVTAVEDLIAHHYEGGPGGPAASASKVDRSRAEASAPVPGAVTVGGLDGEQFYQWLKGRLLAEASADPTILEVLVRRPEIRVKVERHTIQVDGDTLRGRLVLLIREGFFDEARESGKAFAEVTRRGFKTAHPNVSRELQELARMGFLTRANKWYTAVASAKGRIVEAEA